MKRWKKIVLALVLLMLLSQIPFAYRRYKLSRLQFAINQLASQRVINNTDSRLNEYKGVMHVHSFLGGHSSGTFDAIISGARLNSLDFVVMTEHTSREFDTAAMTLQGRHAGILFLNGNEASLANGDHLLIIPGNAQAASRGELNSHDFLAAEKANNALVFVAYPQEFKSDWRDFNGVEIYNVFTNARRIHPVIMFFDGLWSYRRYPDLLFATFFERPAENLKLWDQALSQGTTSLVATAGNDAHANIGLSLIDSSGKKMAGFQLDPYERSFRLVRMHVLLPSEQQLTSETLQEALKKGHCFIAFDIFGDATGFRFLASNANESKSQGDLINFTSPTSLTIQTPLPSRIVIFRNGSVVHDQSGVASAQFEINEKGVYRVEVYLPQLPKPVSDQPWIISNPIYVQ